jgi:hypothetical protein
LGVVVEFAEHRRSPIPSCTSTPSAAAATKTTGCI